MSAGATKADVELRPFDPGADMASAAELINASSTHDHSEWLPSATTLAEEWAPSARFDPASDVLLAWSGSELVGLATMSWRKRGDFVAHELDAIVRPAWRRRGLGTRLLGEVERRARVQAADIARTDGLPHVLAVFFEPDIPGTEAFAMAAGYRPHTYGFLMRRPLDAPVSPAELPDGLEVRPVTADEHRAIWDADVEAFRDHAEPSERDEDDYIQWYAHSNLDTSLWRVAWAGDEVAGSVMTFVWPEENAQIGIRRAWLEHVSVRRPWRRRGLASALITDTLLMLKGMDFEEAMLGVHGENPTGAVGLYERAGFHVHRRWVLWRKPLPDGGPRVT